MNERIKELYGLTCLGAGNQSEEDFCETFAELLLKDVLTIVKNNTPSPDPYNESYDKEEAAERTANDIRDEIKYRFGVKQ